MAGLAAGADGVHVEVHDCPEEAKSDGPQALLPEQYAELAESDEVPCRDARKIHLTPAGEDSVSRRTIIAGNWKMNTRASVAASLAKGVSDAVGENPTVEVAVCPPALYLSTAADVLAGSAVGLGAQNLYPAADGAFTGEINAEMLCDVGLPLRDPRA